MRTSFRLATVFGIDLNLQVTFALVLVMGAWPWRVWGASGALFGALLSLATFTFVVLHELGHSLVAKAFGIPVSDITLTPIGGVARLKDRPRTPTQELLIAIAGPAVNVVLAVAFAIAGVLVEGPGALLDAAQTLMREPPRAEHLWVLVILGNVMLAVFNMLPALPMDGGRVLRALLSYAMDAERATRVAALVARVIAVGLLLFGFSNWVLVGVAVVVLLGASAEVREARFTRVLSQVLSGDVVSRLAPRFELGTTLGEAVQQVMTSPMPVFAVEQSGRFIGVVLAEDLLEALRTRGAWGFVSSVVRRDVPVVEARDSLDVARSKMMRSAVRAAAVLRQGAFLGVISEVELASAMRVAESLSPRSGEKWLTRVERPR